MRMARYWPLVAAMLLVTLLGLSASSTLALAAAPASDPLADQRIYLDPGHGVGDRGGNRRLLRPLIGVRPFN